MHTPPLPKKYISAFLDVSGNQKNLKHRAFHIMGCFHMFFACEQMTLGMWSTTTLSAIICSQAATPITFPNFSLLVRLEFEIK